MKRTLKILLTLAIASPISPILVSANDWDSEEGGKSIYGADNRIELYNASPKTYKLADSVVSLWKEEDVRLDPASKVFTLRTSKFSDLLPLCPGEPFREQPSGAFCSGSLVGEDIVMTAGHCVRTAADCAETKIVFGFAIQKAGGVPTTKIAKDEVYTCKTIVKRFLGGEPGSYLTPAQGSGPDYALIQLDRKVAKHTPLSVNMNHQNLKKGDKVKVIGHPVGLPLKIAGGTVRTTDPQDYFVTDLDTFSGNSGSPVFNSMTGLIEGILVRGAADFRGIGGGTPAECVTMAKYPQTGGRGEDVTKISVVAPFIPGRSVAFKDMREENLSDTARQLVFGPVMQTGLTGVSLTQYDAATSFDTRR
jgi:hypothetical protein